MLKLNVDSLNRHLRVKHGMTKDKYGDIFKLGRDQNGIDDSSNPKESTQANSAQLSTDDKSSDTFKDTPNAEEKVMSDREQDIPTEVPRKYPRGHW